jgi:hypothetical protein
MAHSDRLSQWNAIVSKQLPVLTGSQARLLGAYSFGMVMSGHCGQTFISDYLARLEHDCETNVRQRLREWCYDAADKCGSYRQAVWTEQCFAPLLRWVLDWWAADQRCLVLTCDASYLRDCFIVLSISVVYRACALPVAWKIIAANTPGSWQPYWLKLLERLAPAVPCDWQVLVLTDRGLYAKWLFLGIVAHGWHPLMRINAQGGFRLSQSARWRQLRTVVKRNGCAWVHAVRCFRSVRRQLDCTLLASWSADYSAPWLLVTDLPPEQAQLNWYTMRAWIECGFKDLKHGGWHWEQTKMTRPERAERLWLVMAVATLWVLSVGGAADAQHTEQTPDGKPLRALSCFRQGLNQIHVANDNAEPLPLGRFIPDYDLSELDLKIMPPKNLPL